MLIKFKLIKFNRCLLFQILEQSELITTNDRDYHKKIYRGIQIDNCKIFSQSFIDINNNDIRDIEYNNILNSLSKLKENLEYKLLGFFI